MPATHTPPAPTNPTFSLAQPGAAPVGVPNFFIDKFRIPPFLLPIYQAAGVQYGIRWEVLAAINEIETDYGRNLNVSSAGALGWMQFMPATWTLYGTDANHDGKRDPYNPVDAIFATARYLKAAGGEQDINKAVFAYNHANWYVDSVLMRARLISGLPADLVGSLTGLTQGHFPVHAEARYADDISPTKAGKKVKKGNAANPIESSTTRKGINIYAKAGSPVIAVQDGRIVKIGNDDRLGKFIMLRDAYGNTYTYGRLKKLAHKYPVPKSQSVTQSQVDKELKLSKDPKPTAPRSAGSQAPRDRRNAEGLPRRTPRPRRPSRKERLFANPYRPRAYKSRRRGPALPQRRGDPRLLDVQVLLHRDLRPQPRRRRAEGPEGRLQGHRRHDPRPHRQDRRHRDRTSSSRSARRARAPRASTRSRSSTAGSCSSRRRSTARPARTRSSDRPRRTRRSARSC